MNPTKLILHFSGFSTILYGFYKKQESYFTIGVTLLQQGPWKDSCVCNVAPGARWPARLAKFRPDHRGSWPRKDGEGSRGALGFDLRVWTGRRWLRRAARWRPGRGSRGGSCSGEAAVNARYPAVVAALGDARVNAAAAAAVPGEGRCGAVGEGVLRVQDGAATLIGGAW
jgi:hypothetical protein